jgi:UPF0148 protein
LSRKEKDDEDIKRMVSLLRQGATLTDLACPACASPLFRLKDGNLWCAKCEKRVIVVKEGEDEAKLARSMALENVETTLLAKIQDVQNRMQHEENVEELQKLSTTLSGLMESLEKTRKAKRT